MLRIIASKMLNFEIRLLLKNLLVTSLTKARDSLPEIMELGRGLNIPKSSQNTNYFGRVSSFCFRIITSKIIIFEIFLPQEVPLVVDFSETPAHTFRKNVIVQSMNLSKSSKKLKLPWLHSSFLALE